MTFRTPQFLWLLALVPFALALLVARERERERLARRFVSERLRGVANPARLLRPYVLAAALALAIVALAGPRAGYTLMPLDTTQSNRILVFDVSQSMAAEDVGTSRLEAAKAIAKRIIDADAGRIGLVLFEADAEVASPLTIDGDAVGTLVDSIGPGDLSEPGSDFANALRTALKLVDSDPQQKADVVLISDGEDQGPKLDDALRLMRTKGIPVTAISVGSRRGATIPTGSGELRDASGDPVVTYAHPEVMEKVAQATGGRFFENPFAEHALDSLVASQRGAVTKKREVQVPIERYQWPLALAFLALIGGSLANRGAE
jgi:Ca-activated chloride channel family protein